MTVADEGVIYNGKLITHLEALLIIAEAMKGVQELWEGQDFDHSDMYYAVKYAYFQKIGGIYKKGE